MASTFLRGRRVPVAVMCGASCGASGLPASRARMWFGSDLLDLVEPELDRRLPVEDVDEDLQLALVQVDLADRAVEVGERSGDDPHHVPLLELETELGLHLFLLDREDLLHLTLRERRRLRTGAGGDEPGHTRRVADDVPGVV